jgi:catechol 2,3-dioxygenase-like lactoylglutathione lyase family enzyme
MIDHTGVLVSDFEKSKKFYSEALKPIGYKLLLEFPSSTTGSTNVAGFGEPSKPDFWVARAHQTIRGFTSPFESVSVR